MKYIKTFERLWQEYSIDDYVLMHYKKNTNFGVSHDINQEMINYLNNNIAQISSFDRPDKSYMEVSYETKPSKNIITWFKKNVKNKKILYKKVVNKYYVIAVGKDKEELEAIVARNKYNL